MLHRRNASDDLWWIGFSCDKRFDVQPNASSAAPAPDKLDGTVDRIHRDEAYVLEQCTWLATQLSAVAADMPPTSVEAPTSTPASSRDPALRGRS